MSETARIALMTGAVFAFAGCGLLIGGGDDDVPRDGGIDAGTDASGDAGRDATPVVDAAEDTAAADAESDAEVDASVDAGPATCPPECPGCFQACRTGDPCLCDRGCSCQLFCAESPCTASCNGAGTTCQVRAPAGGDLGSRCVGGATCHIVARDSRSGGTEEAPIVCRDSGTTCVTECPNTTGGCHVACGADAMCTLICGEGVDCSMACENGPVSTCTGASMIVHTCGTSCM